MNFLSSLAVALIALVPPAALAADMPTWVLPGILHVESRSFYHEDGRISYVDRRIGQAGERGPFQMTPAAFAMVAKADEHFEELAHDYRLAEAVAVRYLTLLWSQHSEHDWFVAAGRWNAGPHGRWSRLWRYGKAVQKAGVK